VAVRAVGITALIETASLASGLPMAVVDARGRTVAARDDRPMIELDEEHLDATVIRRGLANGATLAVGPVHPQQQLLARFLIDRLVTAANAALHRDDARRPRGSGRTMAAEALLAQEPRDSADRRTAALALGLDPDGVFVVAVTTGGSEAVVSRLLGKLGPVYLAGSNNGRRASLIAVKRWAGADNLTSRVNELKRLWCATSGFTGATLALSAPSIGVTGLPQAAAEARFLATLQDQPSFSRRAASFASIDDIGAMRLLYQLRDSSELRQFVADALGPLEQRDKRGTLRATLREFLSSGGSHVQAASRLGIHRNTLAYRLRRIGEFVGKDVGDPGIWLTLHLALSASEMLSICSEDR
jgi:hypothetical protein